MAKLKLKVEKAGHINPHTKTVGFVPRVITSGTAGYEDLVAEACHNTTLHKAEAKVGLELCMEAADKMLMQGYIVDLGPVGKLYPSCTGKWVEKAEEMELDSVVPSINYRPTKQMVAAVRGAALQWAKKTGEESGEGAAE